MKIALGQINPTVNDFAGNSAKIVGFSRRAQNSGASLILFPELSICGYPPRDLVDRPSFLLRNRETLDHIAHETKGIAVVCGCLSQPLCYPPDAHRTDRYSQQQGRQPRCQWIWRYGGQQCQQTGQ